jgi:hypothetical protein
MRRSVAFPVAALLLLGATACTGEDNDAAPVPTSGTTTASPAPQASGIPPSATGVSVVRADAAYAFQAPSGNISCSMERDNATCEIRERTFDQPKKPSGCEVDYGDMISLAGDTRAEFACHGDTVSVENAPVLPYGERVSNGSVVCTSEESALSCSTSTGSHGFELSRASYRLY